MRNLSDVPGSRVLCFIFFIKAQCLYIFFSYKIRFILAQGLMPFVTASAPLPIALVLLVILKPVLRHLIMVAEKALKYFYYYF